MIPKLDLSKIIQYPFPESQYYKEEQLKTQIVLHHTVSGVGAEGDIKFWMSDSKKIATAFVVARDGVIYQCFSSKYWGYHLGLQTNTYKKYGATYHSLDKTSIGIEIDSYGALTNKNGTLYTAYNTVLNKPLEFVQYVKPFRGSNYFEKYTQAQIDATAVLVNYLCDKYNIPKDYNESMWDVSKEALEGKPGVWSHVSVRTDKSDLHPQPEVITMLKSLK